MSSALSPPATESELAYEARMSEALGPRVDEHGCALSLEQAVAARRRKRKRLRPIRWLAEDPDPAAPRPHLAREETPVQVSPPTKRLRAEEELGSLGELADGPTKAALVKAFDAWGGIAEACRVGWLLDLAPREKGLHLHVWQVSRA